MKQKLNNIFFQPYPFYYTGKEFLAKIGSLIAATTLILYFTQPFKVTLEEQRISYFFTCFAHATVAGVVFWFFFKMIDSWRNDQKKWRVVDEIIALIVVFILIGIAEFLVRDLVYIDVENWSWQYLLDEVLHTFIIGILLSFIFVPLNYKRLYQKNYEKAIQLETAIQQQKEISVPKKIRIKTQLKTDDFELNPEEIMYVKSAENYVEIYTFQKGKTQQVLKRIPLKDLLEQLKPFPFIMKTHRSYLVNKYRINHISGNAQGYQLMLENCKETIPVSRNFIKKFNATLNRTL